jgi:hypothetical protein
MGFRGEKYADASKRGVIMKHRKKGEVGRCRWANRDVIC